MTNPDNSSYGGLCSRCREIECTDECMTNPDNVGGLPELPEPTHILCSGCAWNCGSGYTANQMRAYGELCRAAPAEVTDEMVEVAQGAWEEAVSSGLRLNLPKWSSNLPMLSALKAVSEMRISKEAIRRAADVAWNRRAAPAGGDVDSQRFEREEELVAQGWVRSEPPALCPHGGEYDEHGGCPMCWRDCRAGEHHWQPLEHCKSCGEIRQADSAPAGSGEVEDDDEPTPLTAEQVYEDQMDWLSKVSGPARCFQKGDHVVSMHSAVNAMDAMREAAGREKNRD